MMVEVVVVGGGVAGVSAALAAAEEGAKTTLLESSTRVGLSKALLPSLLAGDSGEDDIVLPEVASLERAGVDVMTGSTAIAVDHKEKSVRLGQSPRASVVYDRLVICTGSHSERPTVRGLSKPNVFVLSGAVDYLELSSALEGLTRIAVSGPVPLALKIGEILAEKGLQIKVFCGKGGLSLQFSQPVASVIRRQASRRQSRVELVDASIESILGVDKVEAVAYGGVVSTCDSVVMIPRSVPSLPKTECELGPNGGLLVDHSMSTSARGIFAAGDSAEFRFKSGSVPARLHSTSRMGGEVAGVNAAGGNALAVPSWAVEQKYFGVEFCSAGLTEGEAKVLGVRAAIEVAEFRQQGGDGDQATLVSMVYDRGTYEVYVLLVAGSRALQLSSAVSLIVSLGVKVNQLLHTESPYFPGSGYEFSPIALTARKILERKRR
jgi:pyruvate/2-oxoglutarate dehydrogenase complex dihydrolipoamide dehydrogenase (E3) component